MNSKYKKSLQNVCRTCMKKFTKAQKENAINNHQSIYAVPTGCKENATIMDLLEQLQPQIKVEFNDYLPTIMCADCVQRLIVAYEFIDMYKSVDKHFHNLLKNIDTDEDDNVPNKPLEIIEVNDHTEDVLEEDNEDDIYGVTKCEFEVEEINVEEIEKEEVKVSDWPEFEDVPFEDMSLEIEAKEPYFVNPYSDAEIEENEPYFTNPYSDASDDEWTPDDICQKEVTKEKKTQNSKLTPKKKSRGKYRKRKEAPEEICIEINDGNSKVAILKKKPRGKNCKSKEEPKEKQNSDHEINFESIIGTTTEKTAEEIDAIYSEKVKSKEFDTEKTNSDCKINMESTSGSISEKKKYLNKIEEIEKESESDIPIINEDGTISCQKCEEVFVTEQIWKEHMRCHRLGKICQRKYTKKLDKRGKPIGKRVVECKECGKEFSKNTSLRIHMRIHTGEQPFLCIECGKSFKVLGSLNTHMLRHKGEKKVQCPHCPKKFICSSGLYGHMMVHSKEKPYVCDICGKAFHMAYLLRKHNLYHYDIKNYPCDQCDMRFVTAEKQRRHMRTHTGEKPYGCKYCEKAFAQSNDLIKHLRQHLGDNVYQCELCPLRYPMARDLRAHFASHKDDDEETRARNLEARLEEERSLQAKLGVKVI